MAFSHYYCSCYLSFPLACIKLEVLDVQAWNTGTVGQKMLENVRQEVDFALSMAMCAWGILLLCGVIRVLRSNTNNMVFTVYSVLYSGDSSQKFAVTYPPGCHDPRKHREQQDTQESTLSSLAIGTSHPEKQDSAPSLSTMAQNIVCFNTRR
jgi:hypothetical protein